MTAPRTPDAGRPRREALDTRSLGLVALAVLLSAGHHVDHVVRGTHVGWPLTAEATPFTFSLAVYPLVVLGLVLSRRGTVGAGYWLLLSGPGAVFLTAVHLGPAAVEDPAEIVAGYGQPLLGGLAVALLGALLVLLVGMSLREARLLRAQVTARAAGHAGPTRQ